MVSAAPAVFLLISMLLLPESPYWLMEQDREEDAKLALRFFREKGAEVELEIRDIKRKRQEKQSLGQGTDSKWVVKRLWSRAFLQPFGIIVGLRTFAQWSGMPILTTYMVTVFKMSGTSLSPELAPIFVGIARLIAACFATVLIHMLPRKVLFGASIFILSMSNFGIATFVHFNTLRPDDPTIQAVGWLPVALVIVIFICHSVGFLPLIHLFIAELFPTDIRTTATGLTLATTFGIASIVVKLFPNILAVMDIGKMFIIFGTSSLLLMIWGLVFIPENHGLSLVKVEEKFDKKLSKRIAANVESETNKYINA